MFSKLLPCIALELVIASNCLQAAPILSVSPGGSNSGNREWFVRIVPDAALFGNHPPNGIGGSLVAHLAFFVENPAKLLSVVVLDRAAWPDEIPGNNPFTSNVTLGTFSDLAKNRVYVSYGSKYLTSGDPTNLLKFTTAGTGLATIRYGQFASTDFVNGARVAQAGVNFDGYTGAAHEAATADFDGDLDVDGADFLKWQRREAPHFGSAAALSDWRTYFGRYAFTELGDFDGDLDVDGADFLKWQRGESPFLGGATDLTDWRTHFGNRPFLSTSMSAGVPEPATFTFALLVGMGFMGLSRGRLSCRISRSTSLLGASRDCIRVQYL